MEIPFWYLLKILLYFFKCQINAFLSNYRLNNQRSSTQAANAFSLSCKWTLPVSVRNSFGLLLQGYCEWKTPKSSVLSVIVNYSMNLALSILCHFTVDRYRGTHNGWGFTDDLKLLEYANMKVYYDSSFVSNPAGMFHLLIPYCLSRTLPLIYCLKYWICIN